MGRDRGRGPRGDAPPGETTWTGPCRTAYLLAIAGLVGLSLGGCLEPAFTPCGTVVCPASEVCAPAGDRCVSESQLAACAEVGEGGVCVLSGLGEGRCRDQVCVVARCGDGTVDAGEACDDGNLVSGDGCSASCRSLERCGNGIPELDERCDCGDGDHAGPAACDGSRNGGAFCRSDCTLPSCGNGALDPLEVCDDGDTEDGDGCSRYCDSTETCGNAIRDVTEQCDDGNLVSGDACQATCALPRCRDGILDIALGEACDDGNDVAGDGCQPNCRLPTCGDDVLDPGEQCDQGADNSNQPGLGRCRLDCRPQRCGDRVVDPLEGCDDGNSAAGDGCRADCRAIEGCGNGYVEFAETCDDGNTSPGDACGPACTACNNNRVDFDEQCDDSNGVDGDGCDNNCTYTGCGNGVQTEGEVCDDGDYLDPASGDGCDLCRSSCGDGIQLADEWCDEGADTLTCDLDCSEPACGDGYLNLAVEGCEPPGSAACNEACALRCGDGRIDAQFGEECDDANATSGDGCDSNCTATRCGNGFTSPGEDCDDGDGSPDGIDTSACDANCTNRVCGDGYTNTVAAETCDDGDPADLGAGDGCDVCQTVCGDGLVVGLEVCDTSGDSPTCDGDCTPPACGDSYHNASAGEGCDDGDPPNPGIGDFCDVCNPTCGNGIQEGWEPCDDGSDGNPFAFDGCYFCATICGDGAIAGAEECDLPGFETSSCDLDCTYAACGDGYTNTVAGEQCDDGNPSSGDGCGDTCQLET